MSSPSRPAVRVVLRMSTSTSPDWRAVNRCSVVSGRNSTASGSPRTAAATARQKSMSNPDEVAIGVDKPEPGHGVVDPADQSAALLHSGQGLAGWSGGGGRVGATGCGGGGASRGRPCRGASCRWPHPSYQEQPRCMPPSPRRNRREATSFVSSFGPFLGSPRHCEHNGRSRRMPPVLDQSERISGRCDQARVNSRIRVLIPSTSSPAVRSTSSAEPAGRKPSPIPSIRTFPAMP